MCFLLKKKRSSFLLLLLSTLLFPFFDANAQSNLERELFEYLNLERKREDLDVLSWDPEVYAVAVRHSRDMAANGIASHTGSDGKEPSDRVRNAKIFSSRTGENIARDINVISAHTLLMQSLDHRANILEPDFTHAAVAIVERDRHLYITQLFIHKIAEFSLEEARKILVDQYNSYRKNRKLSPLALADSLSSAAQAHADVQTKLDSMSPMLAIGSIGKVNPGTTVVTVYTSTSLTEIPKQIHRDLEAATSRIGVGFKRAEGEICTGGCYLIVLVLA